MQQIRITRTPELDKVFAYLQMKYRLLSEAEIVKVLLSEVYFRDVLSRKKEVDKEVRRAYEFLKQEGVKLSDKFLAKRGIKKEKLTEEDFYKLLENV